MLAGLKLVSNAKVPKTYILFNCNWGGGVTAVAP